MSKTRIGLGAGGAGLGGVTFVLDRVWLNPEPWVLWTGGTVSVLLIVLAVLGPALSRALQAITKSEATERPQTTIGGHSANLDLSKSPTGGNLTVNVGDHVYHGTESAPVPVPEPKVLAEFELLHEEGTNLLKRDKSLPPREWRQRIIKWFEGAEDLVAQHRPSEGFMFRTISRKPNVNEKFDDCPKLLSLRLTKLRLIIGRMHGGEE